VKNPKQEKKWREKKKLKNQKPGRKMRFMLKNPKMNELIEYEAMEVIDRSGIQQIYQFFLGER
jgi:hypothetical protein